MREFILNFIKGLGMGAANVIPGVSGGTIALITGIFERLINSIKSFNLEALKLFFTGKWKAFAQHVDLGFLVSVFLGIIVAIVTVAKLFKYLFDHGLINKEFKSDERNETIYVPWTALFKVFLDIDGNVYTTALKTQAMRPTKSKRMEKEKAEWQKVIEECLNN